MTAPDWIHGDVADLRRWRNACPEVLHPVLPADVTITPLAAANGCPGGLQFTPATVTAPDTVYFHGGGFFVGSPETHRIVAAWIAHLSGSRVTSVRYRLAPEHPQPAQAQDAVAAIRRCLATQGTVRLAGDSAGALAALWGHAALTPAERARVAGTLLIYGAAGPAMPPLPDNPAHEADGIGPRSIAAMYDRLDPQRRIPDDPALDPLAPGFVWPARLCVLAAGDDPVLPDSQVCASRAQAAGSTVRLILAEGQAHGFLSNLPAPAAMDPLVQALDWLSA